MGGICGATSVALGRRSTVKPLVTAFRGIEIVGSAAAAACSLSRKVVAGALIDRRRDSLIGGEAVLLPGLENAGFGVGPSYTEGVLILMIFLTSSMAANLFIHPISSLLERGPPPSPRPSSSIMLPRDRLLSLNRPFFRNFRNRKNSNPMKTKPPRTPVTAPAAVAISDDGEEWLAAAAVADEEGAAAIDECRPTVAVG